MLDMDMTSFGALVKRSSDAYSRSMNSQLIDLTWSIFIGAQCTQKGVEKHIKSLARKADPGKARTQPPEKWIDSLGR